uniref:Ferredoxin-dependent glutamate synthase n=1 Tax=Hildenbrandia rivularis TaxID=135206 RepID=A0A1C9CFH7_9FLOR|nr:ferredoxin-dependent glutamate synthase [Hildenbrandia rivularis]AOM67136.1 ferredoxin-dependent glutamate synthase [Hildenbrandia rivularis]
MVHTHISHNLGNIIDQYPGYPCISEERDSCGVGFLVDISNSPKKRLIVQALKALTCMEHRGACGADYESGDGSGITTQIPWKLFKSLLPKQEKPIRNIQSIAVGMIFLPPRSYISVQKVINWVLQEEGFDLLGWRKVPTVDAILGQQAKANKPEIQQCFVKSLQFQDNSLEQHLFIVKRKIEKIIAQISSNWSKSFYICSFSSQTIIYKGMVKSAILGQFYQDLYHPDYSTSFVMYHRRFSTNTNPKWPLSQPMRYIAHNGEINTIIGNLNWMKSREQLIKHGSWKNRIEELLPITNFNSSDSANLDSVTELLIASGKTPQEALMILIPEAYQQNPNTFLSPAITNFYDYYNAIQEPWDGPALVMFTDGKVIGATLDRNGLRPARYCITKDNLIIVSSESGVIRVKIDNIQEKGRLGPGQMFCVDITSKIILDNWKIKNKIATKLPYNSLLKTYYKVLKPQKYSNSIEKKTISILHTQTLFGYSNEDVELVIEHMASTGKEPTYCMGDDIPLAVLSNHPHVLYDYFKQKFAQVTNPAIDPLRESLVMSLAGYIGSKIDFLQPELSLKKSIKISSPILNGTEIQELCRLNPLYSRIDTSFKIKDREDDFKEKLLEICYLALEHAKTGVEIIILSDYTDHFSMDYGFLPPLLVTGTVHHFLIEQGWRQQVSLIVETGQCWNTHHFACLIGYGASAIYPYLAFKTVRIWWQSPRTQKFMSDGNIPKKTLQESQHNYRCAIEAGLLKILSKMGISLLSSYHGAQIFEVLGLGPDIIDVAFRGTISRIGGLNLKELSHETFKIHSLAFDDKMGKNLRNYGFVQYRPSAEFHMNNPNMSRFLHKAVRANRNDLYIQYRDFVENRPPTNLRDLLTFKKHKLTIALNDVEPISAIISKFCTGGMSLGALSREAHETLAVAMNRIGGKSNSGEGGEDYVRYTKINEVNQYGESPILPNLKGLKTGDLASSGIKQIASGRFGVTPEYLIRCKQIEIKIAQGAKPGEGGQLPAKKVSPYIASLRKAKPGVTLISPPPHHDIYSIEDLAQLIFDLHQINPDAQVSVKLVSEAGIGTIAAGVTKANADIIQISGHEGGTGASPLSSIKHAGIPWELGIVEVHQTLLANQLRHRVILRVDGGIRTGKDVILSSILGAEEFGFGTVAMIATGCIMARVCHTNNCPVGVTSQKIELRKRFPGIPADLVNFFVFIAQEIRMILAELGYKNLKEIIGKAELLTQNKETTLKKTQNINLNSIRHFLVKTSVHDLYNNFSPHDNGVVLDDILLSKICNLEQAIKSNFQFSNKQPIAISNVHRSVGTRISNKIVRRHGEAGFKGQVKLLFKGCAGQSFGAFLVHGMQLTIIGEANDYVGKGINGGEIIIYPETTIRYETSKNVIIGNTCLYGATGGHLFASGHAGERFAIRNSFAQAVIEGVGDHACEYMTGGVIVILGKAGKNIAAGMTGGLTYLLDENNDLISRINPVTVQIKRIKTLEGSNQLQNLIKTHKIKTNSIKATYILDNWPVYKRKFWQLVPLSEGNSKEVNLTKEVTKLYEQKES